MLDKTDSKNFDTLMKAARDVKRVCLVECTDRSGAKRSVICVINPLPDKAVQLMPIAMMLTLEEIEGLTPPTSKEDTDGQDQKDQA